MDHFVAIGANGPEISDRIYRVSCSDLRQRNQMVDVYESSSQVTVHPREVEATDCTGGPKMCNTGRSRGFTPFVCVYSDRLDRTLEEVFQLPYFVGRRVLWRVRFMSGSCGLGGNVHDWKQTDEFLCAPESDTEGKVPRPR